MTWHFTGAEEADLPTLAAIDRASFEFSWTLEQFKASYEVGHRFLLIRDESGRIAGFTVYMAVFDQAEILTIAVDPSCRRQGIGTLLLQRLFADLMSGGVKALFLEVRVSNAPARGLYAKTGFVEISRRKGYYPTQDGREDAIVMQKTFSDDLHS
ncbi:MAG TPA: ribosomal protein S18-alanine N-acetyltransferase [Candidatus Aphodousia gallistercoris]|nr:ribosomal protein S18-alanine N-acetyltransferase [Candidatus Aphodousia gallistercoris]